MTDRIRVLTVVLDRDYRDDDVQEIVNAIKMTKGVADVTTTVVEGMDYVNRSIFADENQRLLWRAIGAVCGHDERDKAVRQLLEQQVKEGRL